MELDRDQLLLTALTGVHTAELAAWRYPPPDDVYNIPSGDLAAMLSPQTPCFAITAADELIGYVCTGSQARVQGLEADWRANDIGLGLRPDLVGQGASAQILPWLTELLDHCIDGARYRVAILGWNRRSLAAAERAGFRRIRLHVNDAGAYWVMEREHPSYVAKVARRRRKRRLEPWRRLSVQFLAWTIFPGLAVERWRPKPRRRRWAVLVWGVSVALNTAGLMAGNRSTETLITTVPQTVERLHHCLAAHQHRSGVDNDECKAC